MKINEVQISSRASAHAQIECAHVRTSTAARVEDLYITLLQIRVEDMQDIIETHSKSQEDCTKLSSNDLQTLLGNNWLNDKVNNNPLTL